MATSGKLTLEEIRGRGRRYLLEMVEGGRITNVTMTTPYPRPPAQPTRTWEDLADALPERNRGEPILNYLHRCQNAAVDAALRAVREDDPNLLVQRTTNGWLLTIQETGQRVEVQTKRQERVTPGVSGGPGGPGG